MASDQRLSTAELLFRSAQQMGLQPSWIIPLDMFAIIVDGQERYVSQSRSPLNSHASICLARDKYVTRRILERHGLPNIPFALPRTQAEAAAFLEQYKTIIAKPVTGSGTRDIHIVTSQLQLEALTITRYILEEYILGKEVRYLVLNGEVIGVYRSEYGTSVAVTRPRQGISYPRASWDQTLVESSLQIAGVLNLAFAAVDYLIDTSGRAYILEVNTMPDLKWFHAPTSGPVVDVARMFMESALDSLRTEIQPTADPVVSSPAMAYS